MKIKPTLLLLTLLLAACGATTPAPTATVTLTPLPPAVTSVPITTTPEPQQPPACTFPLAGTTTAESTPETYTFSEPRVVLKGNYFPIVSWLPDNQNVLITYENDHLFDGILGHLQTIELFNPKTQATQIYATRRSFGERKILGWNPELNAIIYPSPKVLGEDKTTNQLIIFNQIRISYGNPDDTQLLADDLPNYRVTVKPDGSQVIYLKDNGKQLYQFYSRTFSQDSLEPEQLLPFDSEQFGHEAYPIEYDVTWRPNTPQLFFYSDYSSTNQTIILDINSGKLCTLSFDGWVYFARWSPNGRYLAVITTHSPRGPIWVNYDLSVLDTLTGDLHKMDSNRIEPPNLVHTVGDLSWAPDNYHLAIIGVAYAASTSPPPSIDRLYLVDFLSGEVDNLFPSYQLYGGMRGQNLAWSPDGTKILANCSTEKEGRLCYIPVHINAK